MGGFAASLTPFPSPTRGESPFVQAKKDRLLSSDYSANGLLRGSQVASNRSGRPLSLLM
jgi:hypothetical protein